MFTIARGDIYDFEVSVFTIGRDDGSEWTFVPFEVGQSHLFPASDRLLLAFGAVGQIRIFDVIEERCVLDVPPVGQDRLAHLHPWAFAPARGAFFFMTYQGVREVSIDGTVDRFHANNGMFSPETIFEIDGDTPTPRLFLGAASYKFQAAVLDPDTGERTLWELPGLTGTVSYTRFTQLQWPSRDGRHVLRHHLGSIVRLAPARRRLWLAGIGDPLKSHPDFVADGQVRYGLAIDVFRTNPFAFQQRIVTRLVTAEDIMANRARSGWNRAACEQGMDVIDALAAKVDHRNWDQQFQLLFVADRDLPRKPEAEDRDFCTNFFLGLIKSVEWQPSGDAFEVIYADGVRRRVDLAGKIGPLVAHVPPPYLHVDEKRLKPIRAQLRNKAIHRIKLPDLAARSCAAAIAEAKGKLDKGLEKVAFRDTLGFNFVLPDRILSESEFFGHVRAASEADRALLVPPLRALMASFGQQISSLKLTMHEQWQGVETHPETGQPRAALVEAAVALATLDPRAFEVLKPWFAAIDGEHDIDCAPRTIAAIAAMSRFEGPDAIRFGLWFAATANQSWRGTPEMTQLMQAAWHQLTPEAFAALAHEVTIEASTRYGNPVHLPPLAAGDTAPPEVAGFPATMPDPPSARSGAMLELLDPAGAWDREARAALEPLLAVAEADHQRLKAAIAAEGQRRRALASTR